MKDFDDTKMHGTTIQKENKEEKLCMFEWEVKSVRKNPLVKTRRK
jgi:hypothetical protein